jgi:UDP-N-acetylmuramoyl-L-alanyl-D-glutamate--2,6-diaminopimelate ligase
VAIELHNYLRELAEQQHESCVIEVSSHALSENRVAGLDFTTVAFTNLSHDHLDFHGDMNTYYQAKKKLFNQSIAQHAVINVDDEYGQQLAEELSHEQPSLEITSVGLNDNVRNASRFVHAEIKQVLTDGFKLQVSNESTDCEMILPLLGQFNVSNALVVIGCLLAEGNALSTACQSLAKIRGIAGRMESYQAPNKPLVLVDFAHTPDGLKQALLATKQHCAGQVYVVFGCGGDRDQAKRPVMGAIAEQYADVCIITNDNPRTETPELIAEQIKAGFALPEQAQVILDRKHAISTAIEQASVHDIVLVAGKGHETTQEVGQIKLNYDERAFVQTLLEVAA